MKNKKRFFIIIVITVIMIIAFNVKTYGITLPWLVISSNNYEAGEKYGSRTLEVSEVEEGKTLKLYALKVYGNEMMNPFNPDPDSLGTFVSVNILSGVTWTSSDESIATVDNNGKVTGIKEGNVEIIAQYDDQSVKYNIKVKKSSNITTINKIDITVPSVKNGEKKLTEEDISVVANDDIEFNSTVLWYKYNLENKKYDDDFDEEMVEANSKYYIAVCFYLNDIIYTEGTGSNKNTLDEIVVSEEAIIKVNNQIIDKTNEEFFEDWGNMIAVKYYIDTAENKDVLYNIIEGKDATYVKT